MQFVLHKHYFSLCSWLRLYYSMLKYVIILCSMPPNWCPVFIREGSVALSLLVVAVPSHLLLLHFLTDSKG